MSDQDFFFDEDEQPKAAEKTPATAPAKKSAASAPAAAPAAQSVTMTVAALIGVIGLLAGLIIGILLPIGGASTTTTTPTTTGGMPTQSAPQLTDEELSTGELPEGHPDIGSMGGGSAETTDGASDSGE